MNDDEKRFLEQIQKENEAAHAETRRQVQAMAAEFTQAQKQNEDAHAETRRQFQATAAEFAEAHAETRRQFGEFAQAIQQHFDTKTSEIEQRFDETTRLMRRHFDTVAEDIKKETHREIQLLAEALAHVDHKVDVNSAKIDGLAADNELFRASLVHIDRRLRVVEDIVLPQKPS